MSVNDGVVWVVIVIVCGRRDKELDCGALPPNQVDGSSESESWSSSVKGGEMAFCAAGGGGGGFESDAVNITGFVISARVDVLPEGETFVIVAVIS